MQARLLESREIAPEVRHFVFEIPGQDRFAFVPGQFVSITANSITRAYSIASPPSGNRFDLCLNRVSHGHLSPYLFDLRPGDLIDIKGPYGNFIFRQPVKDSVLVATGTGIAPFRGMLQAQLPRDPVLQFTLIFGVRYEHGMLYRAEFEELAANHPNFRFWPTLSRPSESWTGRTGHVQNHILEAIGPRRDLDVYICGLKLMVDDVRRMLKELDFERQHIIYEKYD